jgi:hypothetical protein
MPFTPPENPRPVRAKLYVESLKLMQWGTELTMRVVTRGDDNKEWSAATPSGSLTFMVSNDQAADQFAPGQEWYLEFTPVPAELAGKEGMG